MGREESHQPTSFHSSIALLQERFRQLQRVKQMREERELQKMLNQPKQFTSNSTLTYHNPQFIMPSTSPPHVSLSLWPSSHPNQDHYATPPTPLSTHSQSLQLSWKNVYDSDSAADSGVDTSLHL
ncbi:uncharacterized protein LOC106774885 [Vigna radiata var. radiata]|uniref:Uncharacterized protein LOC106774885 n=1 Tax=Vigna radiata var. radiata TaxID=3916 RepID=A0A1S3VGR2_VIGRR|nr:uncharacterized protein LOC106774885 [Vigna radiata var. radiata]